MESTHGVLLAYSCMVLMRMEMYRRLASVFDRPLCWFHASLHPKSEPLRRCQGRPAYHFSRSACVSSPLAGGRSMTPATSPSVGLHQPGPGLRRTRFDVGDALPMLCLYSPYSFSLADGGGLAEPVRGIFLTVLRAWTNTRSTESDMLRSLRARSRRGHRRWQVLAVHMEASAGDADTDGGTRASRDR